MTQNSSQSSSLDDPECLPNFFRYCWPQLPDSTKHALHTNLCPHLIRCATELQVDRQLFHTEGMPVHPSSISQLRSQSIPASSAHTYSGLSQKISQRRTNLCQTTTPTKPLMHISARAPTTTTVQQDPELLPEASTPTQSLPATPAEPLPHIPARAPTTTTVQQDPELLPEASTPTQSLPATPAEPLPHIPARAPTTTTVQQDPELLPEASTPTQSFSATPAEPLRPRPTQKYLPALPDDDFVRQFSSQSISQPNKGELYSNLINCENNTELSIKRLRLRYLGLLHLTQWLCEYYQLCGTYYTESDAKDDIVKLAALHNSHVSVTKIKENVIEFLARGRRYQALVNKYSLSTIVCLSSGYKSLYEGRRTKDERQTLLNQLGLDGAKTTEEIEKLPDTDAWRKIELAAKEQLSSILRDNLAWFFTPPQSVAQLSGGKSQLFDQDTMLSSTIKPLLVSGAAYIEHRPITPQTSASNPPWAVIIDRSSDRLDMLATVARAHAAATTAYSGSNIPDMGCLYKDGKSFSQSALSRVPYDNSSASSLALLEKRPHDSVVTATTKRQKIATNSSVSSLGNDAQDLGESDTSLVQSAKSSMGQSDYPVVPVVNPGQLPVPNDEADSSLLTQTAGHVFDTNLPDPFEAICLHAVGYVSDTNLPDSFEAFYSKTADSVLDTNLPDSFEAFYSDSADYVSDTTLPDSFEDFYSNTVGYGANTVLPQHFDAESPDVSGTLDSLYPDFQSVRVQGQRINASGETSRPATPHATRAILLSQAAGTPKIACLAR